MATTSSSQQNMSPAVIQSKEIMSKNPPPAPTPIQNASYPMSMEIMSKAPPAATTKATATSASATPTPKATSVTNPAIIQTPAQIAAQVQAMQNTANAQAIRPVTPAQTITGSQLNPNQIVSGAQTGTTAGGQGIPSVPTTYQAYTSTGTDNEARAFLAQQAKQKADAEQLKANQQAELQKATAAGTTSYYDAATGTWKTGSSPETQAIQQQVAGTVTGGTTPTGTVATGYEQDAGMQLLKNQQQAIVDRLNQQQQAINAQYDARIRATAQQQASESGQSSMMLARMGAFGTTASGISYMQKLDSAHSQQLNQLESERQNAIFLAQDAASKEQLDLAYKSLDRIDKLNEQARAASSKRLDDLKKAQDLQDKSFKDMAEAGYTLDEIPEGYFQHLDEVMNSYGVPVLDGTSEAGFIAAQKAAQATKAKTQQEQMKAQVEAANAFISFADKMETGIQIPFGNSVYTYQGTNKDNIATGTEQDANGKLVYWEHNKKTGATKTYDLGVQKAVDGWQTMNLGENGVWFVNPKTQETKPAYATTGQKVLDASGYATGQTGPALPGHEKNAGQCGAMANYFYGDEIVGDSLQSKLAPLSEYAITNVGQIQPGMTFVQNIGKNGHIGFIESTGIDPVTKKQYIQVFDSNYHNDGKVEHGRKIYLDDPTLAMISDYPAPNFPTIGTDAPNVLKEEKSTKEKPLSAAELKKYQDMGYDVRPGMSISDVKEAKAMPTAPSELKTTAYSSAKELLDKFNKGEGTSAVGLSRVFQLQRIPGTSPRNFEIQFNNLKSLLQLDNVKYLKGQGQISDSERKLLADASSKLSLDQSEEEFKTSLEKIVRALSGEVQPSQPSRPSEAPPTGEIWVMDKNGEIGSLPEKEFDPSQFTKL